MISVKILALVLGGGVPLLTALPAGASVRDCEPGGGLASGLTGGLCEVVDGVVGGVTGSLTNGGASDSASSGSKSSSNDSESSGSKSSGSGGSQPGAASPGESAGTGGKPAGTATSAPILPTLPVEVSLSVLGGKSASAGADDGEDLPAEDRGGRGGGAAERTEPPTGPRSTPVPEEQAERDGADAAGGRPEENRPATVHRIPAPSPSAGPERPADRPRAITGDPYVHLLWPGGQLLPEPAEKGTARARRAHGDDPLGTALTICLLMSAILAARVVSARRSRSGQAQSIPFEPASGGHHRLA